MTATASPAGEIARVPVTAGSAQRWAAAAAMAACCVPAEGPEALAWMVRGWSEVAVGCLIVGAAGFAAMDEVICAAGAGHAGRFGARLRELRAMAGRVPSGYPDSRPIGGAIRPVRASARRAAGLVAGFGAQIVISPPAPLPRYAERTGASPAPSQAQPRSVSARQLAWGAQYRPSAALNPVNVPLPIGRRLVRRAWMCLPGPVAAAAEVESGAPRREQQIWRGIHDGAHLDHLAMITRQHPAAPSPAEFGAGLLVAESYAMAVEMLAAVECAQAGQGEAARQLGLGLIERAYRLPGGRYAAAKFSALPGLAEAYVLGPLRILAGHDLGPLLPADLSRPLLSRWLAACAAYRPAAEVAAAAADLLRPQRRGGLTRMRYGASRRLSHAAPFTSSGSTAAPATG